MSNEEIYDRLRSMLREFHFDWVVDELDEQVQLGKLNVRKVQTVAVQERQQMALVEIPNDHLINGPNAKYMVATEYSPAEQLILLLSSVEQILVNQSEMQRDTLNVLSRFQDIDRIEFVDSANGETQHTIVQEDLQLQLQLSESINNIIHQIRGSINNG